MILIFALPLEAPQQAAVPRWPTLASSRSRGRRVPWSGGSVRAAVARACSRASLPPLLTTYWILRPVPGEERRDCSEHPLAAVTKPQSATSTPRSSTAFRKYLSAVNARAFAELAMNLWGYGWWLHGGTVCSAACFHHRQSLSLQTHVLQKFFTVHWDVAERNKQRHRQVSKQQKAQWSFLRYWKLNRERIEAALGFCQMKRNPREALGRAFK